MSLNNQSETKDAVRITFAAAQMLVGVFFGCACSRTLADNLLVNGDFENGNAGFYTRYEYHLPPDPGGGTYTITTNPLLYNGDSATISYYDHTYGTGSGHMMAVNGSTDSSWIVWRETVAVVPNSNYNFEAWYSNWSWNYVGGAYLEVSINGSVIGSFNADPPHGYWSRFAQSWNSGSSTTATISFRDLRTNGGGNDFALDDLSFNGPSPVPLPSVAWSSLGLLGSLFIVRRIRRARLLPL